MTERQEADRRPGGETGTPGASKSTRQTPFQIRLVPFCVGALLLIVGIIWAAFSKVFVANAINVRWESALLTGIIIAVVGFSCIIYSILRAQHAESQSRISEARRELAEAAEHLDTTISGLMKANAKQRKAYDKIAQSHADTAFLAGIAAISAGFVVLFSGSVLAILAHSTETKYSATILTAVGAALSAYIGNTFITMQRGSMRQMREYYQQPLNESYILALEWIVDRMGEATEAKARARADIVRSVTENLLQSANSEHQGERTTIRNRLKGQAGAQEQ
jgi:uncharacterized membrane protein SirB2